MAGVLHRLRQQFDVIVIDSPPILPVVDARILADYVDQILFVVKWRFTAKDAAQRAMRLMATNNRKFTGFIINQVPKVELGADYGYGPASYRTGRRQVSKPASISGPAFARGSLPMAEHCRRASHDALNRQSTLDATPEPRGARDRTARDRQSPHRRQPQLRSRMALVAAGRGGHDRACWMSSPSSPGSRRPRTCMPPSTWADGHARSRCWKSVWRPPCSAPASSAKPGCTARPT